MTYLLYGEEEYLINKEINKISTKNDIQSINTIKYDYQDNIRDIIDNANTYSMFDGKKMIIVSDFTFTTDEKDIKNMEAYLKNPNPDTIIIFKSSSIKLDERKKLVKLFRAYASVEEFIKIKNPTSIVRDMLNGYEIDNNTLEYLIERVGNNIANLHNEIDKLIMYKDNDRHISKDDIDAICTNNVDSDTYKFIDYIAHKDKKKAMEMYYSMLKMGDEPIRILVTLANQFRLIYQAKNLYLKGYSEGDIATMLHIHPYPIKLALEKGRTINDASLLTYLSDLADLDYQIKAGSIEKSLGLELFIINM